jgi:hypothetical protein
MGRSRRPRLLLSAKALLISAKEVAGDIDLAGNRRTLAWKSRRVSQAGGVSCGPRQRRQSRTIGARLKQGTYTSLAVFVQTPETRWGKSGMARNVSMRSKKRP